MTRIEILEEIIKQKGSCKGIRCVSDKCPLSISYGKGECSNATIETVLLKATEMLAKEKKMKKFNLEDYKEKKFGLHCLGAEQIRTANKIIKFREEGEKIDRLITVMKQGYRDLDIVIYFDSFGWDHISHRTDGYSVLEFDNFNWGIPKFKVDDTVRVLLDEPGDEAWVKFAKSKDIHTITGILGTQYELDYAKRFVFLETDLIEVIELIIPFAKSPCSFKQGDKVECSFVNDFNSFVNCEFYAYEPKLKLPFIVIEEDTQIVTNMPFCRKFLPQYKAYWKFDKDWKGKQVKQKNFARVLTIKGIYYNWDKKSTEICAVDEEDNFFIFSNADFLKNYIWIDGTPCGEEIK